MKVEIDYETADRIFDARLKEMYKNLKEWQEIGDYYYLEADAKEDKKVLKALKVLMKYCGVKKDKDY